MTIQIKLPPDAEMIGPYTWVTDHARIVGGGVIYEVTWGEDGLRIKTDGPPVEVECNPPLMCSESPRIVAHATPKRSTCSTCGVTFEYMPMHVRHRPSYGDDPGDRGVKCPAYIGAKQCPGWGDINDGAAQSLVGDAPDMKRHA